MIRNLYFFCAWLLFIGILWSFCPVILAQTSSPTPDCLHTGDTINDGHITAADAQQAFSIAIGLFSPTFTENCAADCNGDGRVTSADAQMIFMVVLGTGNCVDALVPPTPTATPPVPPENFSYIPPGNFSMGSPADEMCRWPDETLHSVTLTQGFFMQQTEVTQRQWEEVFESNPAYFTNEKKPVEQITWFDAIVFCNRLSLARKLTPCYYADANFSIFFNGTPPVTSGTVYWDRNADGYRLPTEAEWEYACRAGTATAYNNGQENTDCNADHILDPLAWYGYNSNTGNGQESHETRLKTPNAWQLYDMHGNIWEWCWDWNSAYPETAVTDPIGPDSGSERSIRSGSWVSGGARFCRSASRSSAAPDESYNFIGFRIAQNVP